MPSNHPSKSCVTDLDTKQPISVLVRNMHIMDAEMTLPDERYRAIRQTRQFLVDLMDPTTYPRIPRYVRTEAYRMLRHYPSDYDLDRLAEKSPDVIIREMEPLTRMIMVYEQSKE